MLVTTLVSGLLYPGLLYFRSFQDFLTQSQVFERSMFITGDKENVRLSTLTVLV